MYIINRTQRHKNFKNLIKVKNVMIISTENDTFVWGIERSGFFNGREKWAKGFENQRV